jgi:diamine N-acetyltransferase
VVDIREAGTQDAELIADLSRRTFYETFAAFNTPENIEKFMNERFTRENLIAEVGSPCNIFLLATLNGDVAGYARIKEQDENFELARLYTLKEFIGKKVGAALMQSVLDIAKKAKKKSIILGVWEHNPLAIDFYNKWGFVKTGEQVFMLGDDAQTDWVMKKEL